jgi:hypothetical protein
MKRQAATHASLASSATNSHLKGLQQYFTPPDWARALGAALPGLRRTIADLHCGSGSLLAGLANDSTRDLLGLDLDPAAGIRKVTTPAGEPQRHFAHGDVLDLFPLLADAEARFDLLALNPPFSLQWPADLLPAPLRKGHLGGKSIDSTLATLRMIPHLLTERGEAMMIANQSTLERLHRESPEDFDKAWLWADLPTFFPSTNAALKIGILYLAAGHEGGPEQRPLITPVTPDQLDTALHKARMELFKAPCIEEPWNACTDSWKRWEACTDEMERRRDPSASNANILLSTDGRLRTWVSAWQEASVTVPAHLRDFLRRINRQHPLALTIQRSTRAALQEALDSGLWTIADEAAEAIRHALAEFERDRAPLAPVTPVQRVGWLDDAEELRCSSDFGPFTAGTSYPIETETVEWRRTRIRPRYQAGIRSEEEVTVKGTDLRISLVLPDGSKVPFMWNPDSECHSLEDLAKHFDLPEVPDITVLRAEDYARNIELLEELERLTA